MTASMKKIPLYCKFYDERKIRRDSWNYDCLTDRSFNESEWDNQHEKPPAGVEYSLDEICQWIYGSSSSFCSDGYPSNMCYAGFDCTTSSGSCSGTAYTMTGSPCGTEMWCQEGTCVQKAESTQAPTTEQSTLRPTTEQSTLRPTTQRSTRGPTTEQSTLRPSVSTVVTTTQSQTTTECFCPFTTTTPTPTTTTERVCFENLCCKKSACCKKDWGQNTKCCKKDKGKCCEDVQVTCDDTAEQKRGFMVKREADGACNCPTTSTTLPPPTTTLCVCPTTVAPTTTTEQLCTQNLCCKKQACCKEWWGEGTKCCSKNKGKCCEDVQVPCSGDSNQKRFSYVKMNYF